MQTWRGQEPGQLFVLRLLGLSPPLDHSPSTWLENITTRHLPPATLRHLQGMAQAARDVRRQAHGVQRVPGKVFRPHDQGPGWEVIGHVCGDKSRSHVL